MNSYEFSSWLQDEMNSRGWSNAELARQAGVTRGAIGNILRGDRKTGPELCAAIARALDLPPETVFRKAGLLPPTTKKPAQINELDHLAYMMDDDDLQELIDYAKMRLKKREGKLTYKQKTSRGLRPARSALKE